MALLLRLGALQAVRAPTGLLQGLQGLQQPQRFRSGDAGDGSGDSLAQRLAAADTPEALMAVVEREGPMDAAAVACALHALERAAASAEGGGGPAVTAGFLRRSKAFQLLADAAAATAPEASSAPGGPGALARMIGALGRLGLKDELVHDSLARELMAGVGRLTAAEVRDVVEGLRGADHSPGVLLLDALHDRLEALKRSGGDGEGDSGEGGGGISGDAAAGVRDGLRELGHDGAGVGARPEDGGRGVAGDERINYT